MTSRAARSDAAYVALTGEASAVRAALAAGDKARAATLLGELQARSAAAAETLGEYDSRKLGETLSELSRSLAALSARPKFAFRARRSAPKPAPASSAAEAVALPAGAMPRAEERAEPAEPPAHVSGRADVKLELRGALRALRVADLTRCVVRVPHPVAGSALVRGCVRCVVLLRARQVRIHDCEGCLFILQAGSGPVIERCSGLVFAPWTGGAVVEGDGWEEVVVGADGADAGAAPAGRNFWDDVKDFNWLQEERSPNWRLLGEDEKVDADQWVRAREA